MASKITCLVTLHGVGFEQPPQPGVDNSGVEDLLVNNVANSRGGGLQAHTYWDNEVEFVKQFCDILRAIANNHVSTTA